MKITLFQFFSGAGVDEAPIVDDSGKVRRKMAVGEGRSMMHWQRLKVPVERMASVTMEEVCDIYAFPYSIL